MKHGSANRGVYTTALILPMGMALQFAMHFLLARVLGVEEFGKFSFLFQVAAISALVLCCGLPMSMQKFIPKFQSLNSHSKLVLYKFWSFGYLGLLSFLLVSISLSDVGDAEVYSRGIYIRELSLVIIAYLTWMWQRYWCLGYERFGLALLPRDIVLPVFVCALVLVLDIADYQKVVLTYSAILIVLSILALLRLSLDSKKAVKKYTKIKLKEAKTVIIEWHVRSLPMGVSAFMQLGMNSWDIILVGILVGMEEAGEYSLALKVALMMSIVSRVVNVSLSSKISSLYETGQTDKLKYVVRRAMLLAGLMGFALFLVLVAIGENLLLLVGEDYANAYKVLIALSFSQLVLCITSPVYSFLNMTEGQLVLATTFFRWMCIAVIANYFLLQMYSITVAACVTAAATILMRIEQFYEFRKLVGALDDG